MKWKFIFKNFAKITKCCRFVVQNLLLKDMDFKGKYPNIYSSLKPVINNIKDEMFLKNLTQVYEITQSPNNQKIRRLNQRWNVLLNHGLFGQHPLFQLLTLYGIPIYHYYTDELEEALGNALITFRNKEQKIRALTRKEEFWNTYFELEVANSLTKEGCKIIIQENIGKFDMRVSFDNINFNMEVTAIRLEKRDEKTVCQNIVKRIENKATQLLKQGVNIIVIAVPLDSKLMPVDVGNALYDPPSKEKVIEMAKKQRININNKWNKIEVPSILETNANLNNVSAIVQWAHKGTPLDTVGNQTRLINIYSREGFPSEIKNIFININKQSRLNKIGK